MPQIAFPFEADERIVHTTFVRTIDRLIVNAGQQGEIVISADIRRDLHMPLAHLLVRRFGTGAREWLMTAVLPNASRRSAGHMT